ncbi:hypothetical protein CXU21_01455 [Akkermansia muciniphila]|nr:hypothetical protein CXU21_01455 [Akkermansia muciniphila]
MIRKSRKAAVPGWMPLDHQFFSSQSLFPQARNVTADLEIHTDVRSKAVFPFSGKTGKNRYSCQHFN